MWLVNKIKLFFGLAEIPEICYSSKGPKDYHDYKILQGGDGQPTHMHTYQCWYCGKNFNI